jgi:spore germination cell wall hydrolase CwlJ-like protein
VGTKKEELMTTGFTQSKTLQDIFVGIAISLALTLTVQQVFHRPQEPIVIEKQVIVKVPVYLTKQDKKQIKCLADNAYFEAGNQTTRGKIAVTNVVMNRTGDDSFPSTPCGVVKQKKQGRCQFSWVCEHKKVFDADVYTESKRVAEQVYLQNIGDVTAGATFYHASYVHPFWADVFDRTTKIGDHIFYREG